MFIRIEEIINHEYIIQLIKKKTSSKLSTEIIDKKKTHTHRTELFQWAKNVVFSSEIDIHKSIECNLSFTFHRDSLLKNYQLLMVLYIIHEKKHPVNVMLINNNYLTFYLFFCRQLLVLFKE